MSVRAAIPAERSKLRRRIDELRHVDKRLALLERELRAGQRPRELIQVQPRKEDVWMCDCPCGQCCGCSACRCGCQCAGHRKA